MKTSKKTYRLMGLLTLGAMVLTLWEIYLFRKTFIPFLIPFLVFTVGGLLAFFLLRKKVTYYVQNQHRVVVQALHGMLLFGGTLAFLFMAVNYYIPTGKAERVRLKVLETGNLARGRRGCGNPYATVVYRGFEKQLIFPCNAIVANRDTITVSLQKGVLGFLVVHEMTVTATSLENGPSAVYQKILARATAEYAAGNRTKAIALFERAVRLNPSDQLPRKRLRELKND